MEINYNNQKIILAEHTSLQDFIDLHVGEKQNGIAVAVNQTIISKNDWSSTNLKEKDNILIIKATQGG